MVIQRGDIWWAELAPPIGRRPVLLLSRNTAYRIRTSVTVAIVTRTVRNIPVEVPIGQKDGMPEKCVVNLDLILTIPKASLMERITTLSAERMSFVAQAIDFALDLKGE